ncbi:uncharacterized protein [Arachis hypogaea]|uniref:uncharacterized protein n=1 Tax=Arachis hypogaea TaxID=3818 RepID=UPI000DECC5E2|nr:uncharacterized protein LOC112747474 [Arachis hypogaea]
MNAVLPVVADGEFTVGMEFSTREAVIKAMKDYTIQRGVDYQAYESEPTKFYAKCTKYGNGCDWLIRVTKMQKKYCWEIRRYNGNHTCTRSTISQDHSKLDSKTVAEAIKLLVEVDLPIKVKSVIAEVQSKFNYTISYRKTWLVKQQAGNDLVPDIRVLHRVFWSYYPSIKGLQTLQASGAVSQDSNNNIVPIAFATVEGETSDAWYFFLSNLRQHVVTRDDVGLIYDRHNSIRSAIERSNGAWSPPITFHMFCIRLIESNFLRKFKAPYLQKLIVNIGYSRTIREYQMRYERLKEWGET